MLVQVFSALMLMLGTTALSAQNGGFFENSPKPNIDSDGSHLDRTFYFSTAYGLLPPLVQEVTYEEERVLTQYLREPCKVRPKRVACALAPHLFDVLQYLGNNEQASRDLPLSVQKMLIKSADAFRQAIAAQNPRFIKDLEREAKKLVPDVSGKSIRVLLNLVNSHEDTPEVSLAGRVLAFFLRSSLMVMSSEQQYEVTLELVKNDYFQPSDFAPLLDPNYFEVDFISSKQKVEIQPVEKTGRRTIFKGMGPGSTVVNIFGKTYKLDNSHFHPQREERDKSDREYYFLERPETIGEVHTVFQEVNPITGELKNQFMLMARPLAIKRHNPRVEKALQECSVDYVDTFLDAFTVGDFSYFMLSSLNNATFDDSFPVLLSSTPLEISEDQFNRCKFGEGNSSAVVLPFNPFVNPLTKDRWFK